MSKDVTVTVHGERGEMFQQVFGTNTVCVESAIGELANLPGLGERHVYKLDLKEITPEQRAKLVSNLAGRFNLPESEVAALMEVHGVPILTDDCTLIVTGDTGRWLMTEAAEMAAHGDFDSSIDPEGYEEDEEVFYDDLYDLTDDYPDEG